MVIAALAESGAARLVDLALFGSTTHQVVRRATCPVLAFQGEEMGVSSPEGRRRWRLPWRRAVHP